MSKENSTLNILLEGLNPVNTNIPSDLEFLKSKLSESIRPAMLIEDDEKKEDKEKDVKTYKDIQRKMKSDLAPTQRGLMRAVGIEDDEEGTNAGQFNKQLRLVKNDKGSVYRFNSKILAKIRAKLGLT